MTLNDIKKYYTTSYKFERQTGMMHNNFNNWKKKGFIPIKTQIILEKLTNGELKADLSHLTSENEEL